MSSSHDTGPDASNADVPLRVAVDVRCLASGELRGFARYTAELLGGFESVDGVELLPVSDEPMVLPVSVLGGAEVHHPAPDREWRREQVGLPQLCHDLGVDVLFGPANRGLPVAGPPSVLTLHDAVEWDPELVEAPTGRSRFRFGYASVASMLGATEIITISDHAASELERVLGIGPDRVTVVSEAPGRAFTTPPDAVERAAMRRALDIAGPYLLYLGGFDAKKSVDTLVSAWARLDPSTTPPLVLGGRLGDEAERFDRIVRDAGGEPGRLRCIGFVPDEVLPALYAEAELFVFPAIAEGYGLPAVEAMAVGTATVIAGEASLPEATRGAAPSVPGRDVAALSAAIRRVLDDDAERARVAAAGRAAVTSRSWADVAADTTVVLRRAAARGARDRVTASVPRLRHVHKWVR